MEPGSSRSPAQAGIQVMVADAGWRRLIRNPERVAARAAAMAGEDETIVVLASDGAVKHLNAQHRGRNKPTNVLTFDPAGPGLPGEIILALGVVASEARAAGKRPADHLAHLVIHGVLHLQGEDHDHAGAARRMEQRETFLLRRLGRPNPWKKS